MGIVPVTRPRLDYDVWCGYVRRIFGYETCVELHCEGLYFFGIRGYYKRTMGDVRRNDIGIYDDAIGVVGRNVFAIFNGNTDPMKKGQAVLKPGIWRSYRFGKHKGKYLALVQRGGVVTVRDGKGERTGWFGINIHKGCRNSTGSAGCQTVYPTQWDAFINLCVSEGKRLYGKEWNRRTYWYVLVEGD